jgi:predicted nucleotidyltransferase
MWQPSCCYHPAVAGSDTSAPDLQPLLDAIRTALPDVVGVWLFGSHATGRAGPHSDIDLAVLAPRPLDPVAVFDAGLRLGVLAGRDVDLVDLRRASIVLRKEVIANGRLLARSDRSACDRFASDSIAMYVDFQHQRRSLLQSTPGRRDGP